MKTNQKNQVGKNTKADQNKNQGKSDKASSKNTSKNEALKSAEPKEDPETPAPATPSTPRREYEDPGHEHVYQPPTANPSRESMKGYVGE